MEKTKQQYVCPKCKSSFINIESNDKSIIYRCLNYQNSNRFCNWEEIEYIEQDSKENNDKEPFLSTFLFKKFEEVIFSYNHLYLIGERLNISKMTKLAKEDKLKEEIEQEILKKYPEWKDEPLKKMFESIQSEMRQIRIEFIDEQRKNTLFFINFIPNQKFLDKKYDLNGRAKLIVDNFTKIKELGDSETNFFILTRNYFSDSEFISLADEIMYHFWEIKKQKEKTQLLLKRYIIVPIIEDGLILKTGIDPQALHILHIVKSEKYFYDKTAIVEESFWKKWEFGSRNTPYNPFGKDPGAFWVITTISPMMQKKIQGKTMHEQSNIINSANQEKFAYIPLTLEEAISKCILVGSLTSSTIFLLNSLGEQNESIDDTLILVSKVLNRKLIIQKK